MSSSTMLLTFSCLTHLFESYCNIDDFNKLKTHCSYASPCARNLFSRWSVRWSWPLWSPVVLRASLCLLAYLSFQLCLQLSFQLAFDFRSSYRLVLSVLLLPSATKRFRLQNCPLGSSVIIIFNMCLGSPARLKSYM